jgi:hypothetical protein
MGAIDHTHTARADLFDDAVVSEHTADQRILIHGIVRHGKTRLLSLVLMLATRGKDIGEVNDGRAVEFPNRETTLRRFQTHRTN